MTITAKFVSHSTTATALDVLRVAVRQAQSEWTGLDWATDLTVGNCDEAYEGRPKALQAAKDAERVEVEDSAEGAGDLGDVAVACAETGDWRGALDAIRQASRAEREYGDDPSWGRVLKIVEAIAAVLAIGARVEAADTDEDYGTGRVIAVEGDMVTVAWASQVQTTQSYTSLREES